MTEGGTLMLAQLREIAAGLLAGCFGGCAFGVYQGFLRRKKRRMPRRAYRLPDALFGVGVALSWLIFWFTATDGSLRARVLIWFGGGFAIYACCLREPIKKLAGRLFPSEGREARRKGRRIYAAAEGRAAAWAEKGAAGYRRFSEKIRERGEGVGKRIKKRICFGRRRWIKQKSKNL